MEIENKERLLQIASKLNEEEAAMCGKEVCAECEMFDKLNLGASDGFSGCGQYLAAKKILAREELIRIMLRDYAGDACLHCSHFYEREDGICRDYASRGNDACFEGMIKNLDEGTLFKKSGMI